MHTCLLVIPDVMQKEAFEIDCPWLTYNQANRSLLLEVEFLLELEHRCMNFQLRFPNNVGVSAVMISDTKDVRVSQVSPNISGTNSLFLRWNSEGVSPPWTDSDTEKVLFLHIQFDVPPHLLCDEIEFCKGYHGILSNQMGCQIAMNALRNGASDPDLIITYKNGEHIALHSWLLMTKSRSLTRLFLSQNTKAGSYLNPFSLVLADCDYTTIASLLNYLYKGYMQCTDVIMIKNLLSIFIKHNMHMAVTSMWWNMMNHYHTLQMEVNDLILTKTYGGVDMSLMKSLRSVTTTVPYDTVVECIEGVSMFTHRDLLFSFSRFFPLGRGNICQKELTKINFGNLQASDIIQLWDIMYCTNDSYSTNFREQVLPQLFNKGLVCFTK